MKNILLVFVILIAFWSCNLTSSKEASSEKCCDSQLKSAQSEYLTIEKLLASPDDYINKTVTIKGLCIHICKNGGKRMFLQGTDEDQLILVLAGNEISSFENELTGSHIAVTGLLMALEIDEEETPKEDENPSCETKSKVKSYQINCTSYKISHTDITF